MRRRLALVGLTVLWLSLSGWSAGAVRASAEGRPPVARPAGPGLLAGARTVDVALPIGVPLAGYGGLERRLWIPDVLNRYPYAFWFKPGTGTHDPITARALVLEGGGRRLLWLAVDLIAVERDMVREVRTRLESRGYRYDGVILAASHTHSGPGAFSRSAFLGFLAVDRLAPAVRARLLDAMVRAGEEAESRKVPARVGIGRGEVQGITRSRVGRPLDPEVGMLKIVGTDGEPIALVWNYAIHGTVLGKGNLLLSGDVMGAVSEEVEGALHVPALYANGAVGDVSPALHGWRGLHEIKQALSSELLAAWKRIPVAAGSPLSVVSLRVGLPPPHLALRNCLGRGVPRWLTLGMGWAFPAESEMVAVAIGDSAWVTIPGELETQLGQAVKAEGRRLFRHAFVVGLANDYGGYFLTPEAYDRPSYIACASLYGDTGGRIVTERAKEILRTLYDLQARGT